MNHLILPRWLRFRQNYDIHITNSQKHGFLHLSTLECIRRFRHTSVCEGYLKSSFTMAVHNVRYRETSKPLDRVYGLHGFDQQGLYRENLRIDYSEESKRDYLRLYINFAKLALKNQSHYFLLMMTSSMKRPFGLPTWCPNLASNSETNRLFQYYQAGQLHEHHVARLKTTEDTRACNEAHSTYDEPKSCLARILENSDSIFTLGAAVDTVAAVGSRKED
jgi:hypothetical protein